MNSYANRKSKDKGARHLLEILNQIKDSILKKRYNLAWQLASKHYEQNRNSLTNQEIYQLCWQSCIAIQKKIYHRLTAKHKRNIAPVAYSHIQHVLSLQLSLHSIILPQLVSQDRSYFNMLYNESQPLDPRKLSEQQLIFQRKNQNSFLPHESIHKQMKKIVKQHLKICNSVLMYKVAKKKTVQDIKDTVAVIQSIFDSVKEHQFPEQVMDFQLIKLSIVEELGIKEGIRCQYRLPLGFLNKIYQRLRKRKEEYLDHYLKKFTSYLVLCFRHLTVSIEDVYVGLSEAKFISKVAHIVCLPSSKTILHSRRKTNLQIQRMLTLQKQSMEQPYSRFSKVGSQTLAESNSTQKKIDSKKKVTNKGQNILKRCAQQGLKVLEDHIQGRRQISEIILGYYNVLDVKKKQQNSEFKEEFIDNAVRLNGQLRNRKKGNQLNDEETELTTKFSKNKDSLLTSLLARPKLKLKSSVFDVQENQQTLIKVPTTSKSKAKFILKNIQMVKKPVHPPQQHFAKINALINNIESQQRLQDLSFDYSDDEQEYQFQRQRKKKIQEYKLKIANNNQRLKSIARNQSTICKDLAMTDYSCNGNRDQDTSTHIAMLDEVVITAIHQRLLGNELTNIPPLKKLQALKLSVQNLNTERKMLVQNLSIRQNESDKFIKENIRSFSHYTESVKQDQKEQIDLIVDAFRKRVSQHVADTRKLVNFNKVKDSFLPKKSQREQKLKIEPKKANRRLSELTFQKIQDAYKTVQGALQSSEIDNQMCLRYQFDQLRRDVSKNQFITQTQKKNQMKKRQSVLANIPTILERTREDDTVRG